MKTLYKTITWILLLTFLSQNIAWSTPTHELLTINYKPLTAFYIPEQYGRIELANRQTGKQGNQPLVVLIKDAHCNYEAQTNISKILDILIRDYKIDLIGAEGASGYVNPSIVLESNPKEDVRKKVSDKFLRTGLLTASEALSINKGKDPGFTIWGVEDLKLYLRDFQAFRDSIGINNSAKHFIELLFNLIGQLKKKIYPEELLEFDNIIKKYQSNELPLTRFIKILYYKYSIPKQHQNLKIVLKSMRIEEKIDFKKVEYERGQLIRQLEKTLPKEDLQELVGKSLLFKLGKIPAEEYYTYLNGQTTNLGNYTRLVNLQSRIDESALFNELEDLTEKIYAKLCKDKISHNLHLLDKDINILNKILSLEATREALTYFKENYARFTPENLLRFIRIQAPLNNINLPPEISSPSFIEDAEKAIIPAEEFYRLAIERDNALVENLVQTMDKNKKDKAVLICGGFHADGIKKLLQDKGISPITITPSITKIQEDSKELYLKRMLDKRIDPEKMLEELGLENLEAPLATTLIPLSKEVKDEINRLSPGIELKDAYTIEELLQLWDSLPEAKNDPSLESLKSFFKNEGRENAQYAPSQQPLDSGGETPAKASGQEIKIAGISFSGIKDPGIRCEIINEKQIQLINGARRLNLQVFPYDEQGRNFIRIGSRIYEANPGITTISLTDILSDPLLWLGNAELVNFFGESSIHYPEKPKGGLPITPIEWTEEFRKTFPELTKAYKEMKVSQEIIKYAYQEIKKPNIDPILKAHYSLIIYFFDISLNHEIPVECFDVVSNINDRVINEFIYHLLGADNVITSRIVNAQFRKFEFLLRQVIALCGADKLKRMPEEISDENLQNIIIGNISSALSQLGYKDIAKFKSIKKINKEFNKLTGTDLFSYDQLTGILTINVKGLAVEKPSEGKRMKLSVFKKRSPPFMDIDTVVVETLGHLCRTQSAKMVNRIAVASSNWQLKRTVDTILQGIASNHRIELESPQEEFLRSLILGVGRGGFGLGGASIETETWLRDVFTKFLDEMRVIVGMDKDGKPYIAPQVYFGPNVDKSEHCTAEPLIDAYTYKGLREAIFGDKPLTSDDINRLLGKVPDQDKPGQSLSPIKYLQWLYEYYVEKTSKALEKWIIENNLRVVMFGQVILPDENPVLYPALLMALERINKGRDKKDYVAAFLRHNYFRKKQDPRPGIKIRTIQKDDPVHVFVESETNAEMFEEYFGFRPSILYEAVHFPTEDIDPKKPIREQIREQLKRDEDSYGEDPVEKFLEKAQAQGLTIQDLESDIIITQPSRIDMNKRPDSTILLAKNIQRMENEMAEKEGRKPRKVRVLFLGTTVRKGPKGESEVSGTEKEAFELIQKLAKKDEKTEGDIDISSQIYFLGYVPQKEVIAALTYTHIMSQASDRETFGRTPIEAVATGVPLIYCRNWTYPFDPENRQVFYGLFEGLRTFTLRPGEIGKDGKWHPGEAQPESPPGEIPAVHRMMYHILCNPKESEQIASSNFFLARRSMFNLKNLENYMKLLFLSYFDPERERLRFKDRKKLGGRKSARTERPAHITYMNIPEDSDYYSSGLERDGKTTVKEIKDDLMKENVSKKLPMEKEKNAMVDNNLLQGLGKTDQEFLAVLSRALAEAKKYPGADLANLKDTTAIALLDKSSHLAEDHVGNGFIGINRLAIEIYGQIQEKFGKDIADNFIQFLLEHELVHELTGKGEEIESTLLKRDAERFVRLFTWNIEPLMNILTILVNVDSNFTTEVERIKLQILSISDKSDAEELDLAELLAFLNSKDGEDLEKIRGILYGRQLSGVLSSRTRQSAYWRGKIKKVREHQFSSINRPIIEIIANAIDATKQSRSKTPVEVHLYPDGFSITDNGTGMGFSDFMLNLLIPSRSGKRTLTEPTIGRFGVGFYSVLNYLKREGDKVIVDTSNGMESHRIIFYVKDGQIKVKISNLQQVNGKQGTTVRLVLSDKDRFSQPEHENFIKNYLQYNTVPIRQNGIEINFKAEEYGDFSNDKTKLFVSRQDAKDGKGEVIITINGVTIFTMEISGYNIPSRIIIDLPPDTTMPKARDRIEVFDKERDYIKGLIDSVLKTQDRYRILNALYPLMERLQENNKDRRDNILKYYIDRLKNDITDRGLKVLPDVEGVDKVVCENPVYLNEELIKHFKEYIPKFETFSRHHSSYKILLAGFRDDTPFIYFGNTILLNKKHIPKTPEEAATLGLLLASHKLDVVFETDEVETSQETGIPHPLIEKAKPADLTQLLLSKLSGLNIDDIYPPKKIIKLPLSSKQGKIPEEKNSLIEDIIRIVEHSIPEDAKRSFFEELGSRILLAFEDRKYSSLLINLLSFIILIDQKFPPSYVKKYLEILKQQLSLLEKGEIDTIGFIERITLFNQIIITDEKYNDIEKLGQIAPKIFNLASVLSSQEEPKYFSYNFVKKMAGNWETFLAIFSQGGDIKYLRDFYKLAAKIEKDKIGRLLHIWNRIIGLDSHPINTIKNEPGYSHFYRFIHPRLYPSSTTIYEQIAEDIRTAIEGGEDISVKGRPYIFYLLSSELDIEDIQSLEETPEDIGRGITEPVRFQLSNLIAIFLNRETAEDPHRLLERLRTGQGVEYSGVGLQSAKDSLRESINFESSDEYIFIREIIQNVLDAKGDRLDIDIFGGEKKIVLNFIDYVGMDLTTVIDYLLIPDNSTKREDRSAIGRFGQGFFTCLKESEEVIVKTSKGDGEEVVYIRLRPQRDGDTIVDIDVEVQVKTNTDGFKGTEIQWIKNTDSPELEAALLKSKAITYGGYVDEKKLKIKWGRKGNKIINKTVKLLGEIETHDGPLKLYRSPDKENAITHRGLFVRYIDKYYLKDLPPFLKEGLLKLGIIIELPPNIELISDRTDIANKEEHIPNLSSAILRLSIEAIINLFATGEIDISILPYDFLTNAQHYQNIPPEIKQDASTLLSGGAIDFTPYINDERKLAQLIVSLPIIKLKNGQTISLIDIVTKLSKRELTETDFEDEQFARRFIGIVENAGLKEIIPQEQISDSMPFTRLSSEVNPESDTHWALIELTDTITRFILEKLDRKNLYNSAGYIKRQNGAIAVADRLRGTIAWNLFNCKERLERLAKYIRGELPPSEIEALLKDILETIIHETVHILEGRGEWTHDENFRKREKELRRILFNNTSWLKGILDELKNKYKGTSQDLSYGLIPIHSSATLKAPGGKGLDKQGGSDSMDEDRGERRYIERLIRRKKKKLSEEEQRGITKAVQSAIGLIPDEKPVQGRIEIHKLSLGNQLGIPRFKGAKSAKDLIYAYVKVKERKTPDGQKEKVLHIYVTEAFWRVLGKNPRMLAFLLDHEWQENMLPTPKSHAEASKRAWRFTDLDGMNPFYKFFIEQLAREEEIDYLVKLASQKHENDPGDRFRNYVINTILGIRNVEEVKQLREELTATVGRPPKILNISYTSAPGSGVAEVLRNVQKTSKDFGLYNRWVKNLVFGVEFSEITAKIHHAIQGDRSVKIEKSEWETYDGVNRNIVQGIIEGLEDSDVIVLHDHHHLGLVPKIKEAKPNIKIIWWCHLDVSSPNLKVWEHLKGYIDEVDLVVFQQRDNVKDVYNRLDIKPPSVFAPPAIIYPTSLIHRSLDNLGNELVSRVLAQHKDKKISVPEAEEAEKSEDAFIRMVLGFYNIDPNRPILLGAGRYDPDKNIEGAIEAFVQAWKQSPKDKKPQFVYAGGILSGDAEGERIYSYLQEYRDKLPPEISRDIHLLKFPRGRIANSLEINALQRAAYIGLQLSRKEGFGLPVAELMWKGKPVIGMNTGGIATQIKDAETGYLVNNPNEAADRILQLLKDPKEAEDMGRRARDYVKNNFLITHMIRNYELLIMSLFNKSIGEWLEYNRAVSIYDLNTHIGETLTMGRVQQFYKILLGQKDEFKKAATPEEKNSKATQISQTLEKARILHHAIEDMLTDGGMAGQLVSEKLLNMFWRQLKEEKTEEKIDFACITLPIGPLNKDRGYDRANKFKKIFYQKVQDYIRRNKPDAFAQYEEIPGAYYGISGTRLYVIGLNEEDLDKIIKEIFPLCLGEIGVPEDETKNYEMYAGHITASLESSEQWKEIQHETDKKEITRLFEKYIQYCKIQATGRADVIEKEIRRRKKVVLGESDEGLLKDHEKDIEKYGNLNTIPEAEYAPQAPDRDGLVPRFSHMMGYIYLAYEDLKNELSDGTNIDTKVTKYLFTLNMRFLESLLDSRYKGVFKKQFFNIILEGIKNGTLSEYIKYLKSFLEDEKTKEAIYREIIFPKEVEYMKELISYFESPLKITKMGDEIWLYIETSKGIIQCFGELDNFNAFNSAFPSPPEDNRDSIYHQILAEIHNLYTQFCTENGYEEKLNRGQIKKFAKYLKKKFLGIIITIPQGTPYDDGYTIKTQPAIIKGKDGKQIGEIKSKDLLTVNHGQRIRLKDMPFHYKDKLRIDGAIHRLYLYEAKKRGSRPRRIAIYDNRIFTADGKGEEDEHDITEEIMSEGWELSPLYGHTGIAFTTDLHGLTDMDPDRISNINTFQKKHMDNKDKVWDTKDDIAEQIVSTLREKGIKGIDPDTIADAIVEAKEGKIKIDFMVLWDSVKGRIDDPKEFFEIAVSISKPINTLLGPAARDRGARFMSCILMAILENLPEDKRKEILNKPNVTDEERLLELIKTIAKEKGIDPNAMQSIFDLFKGGKEILSADPGLDIGKMDGSYFTLISEMERLTGISGGKIINAFKRHFGIGDVRQSQGEIIEDTLLYREAKRLEEYNRQTSGNYPLEQIDKKLWNSDFGRGAILKDLGKNDKSWYLSGLDAVSKDVKNMVNALANTKAKPIIEDPTPVGIVFDIDKYIIENEDGTFSYNPVLASVLNNPNIGKGIMIGFRVSEGKPEGDKQRLERKITFLKTAGILGESVLILPENISNAQEIMMRRTNLQQNQIVFAVDNTEVIPEELQTQIKDNKLKVIVLDEDTSLHAALVFAVLYARLGNIFENNKLTDTARDIIRTSLSKWNIRDEEIKDLLSELETTGFFILKLIRIADTLKEFQNRKIFIDVAA